MKVFCATFLLLQFEFVTLRRKSCLENDNEIDFRRSAIFLNKRLTKGGWGHYSKKAIKKCQNCVMNDHEL